MRKVYDYDSDSDSQDDENHAQPHAAATELHNYKGICDEEEESKYFDPVTGAHFEYFDF